MPKRPSSIQDVCNAERDGIKMTAGFVKDLLQHPQFSCTLEIDDKSDHGEMRANIMLAYRHLEDARMRLGKVIQAAEGGTSIYDKKG